MPCCHDLASYLIKGESRRNFNEQTHSSRKSRGESFLLVRTFSTFVNVKITMSGILDISVNPGSAMPGATVFAARARQTIALLLLLFYLECLLLVLRTMYNFGFGGLGYILD